MQMPRGGVGIGIGGYRGFGGYGLVGSSIGGLNASSNSTLQYCLSCSYPSLSNIDIDIQYRVAYNPIGPITTHNLKSEPNPLPSPTSIP